jgi:hypothetical protein
MPNSTGAVLPDGEREVGPTFHDIRNRLGEALLRLVYLGGTQPERERERERALDGTGRSLQARLSLGLVHCRADRLNEVRDACDDYRSHDPASPRVRVCQPHLGGVETRSPG